MKVYELMNELSDCPAGAEVKFHRLADKDEIKVYENDLNLYVLDFPIREIQQTDDVIFLDGWF